MMEAQSVDAFVIPTGLAFASLILRAYLFERLFPRYSVRIATGFAITLSNYGRASAPRSPLELGEWVVQLAFRTSFQPIGSGFLQLLVIPTIKWRTFKTIYADAEVSRLSVDHRSGRERGCTIATGFDSAFSADSASFGSVRTHCHPSLICKFTWDGMAI
jgi:hypothetical protein